MDIIESMYIAHHLYQVCNLTQLQIERKSWSLVRSRPFECYSVCVLLIATCVLFHSLFVEEDFVKVIEIEVGQKLALIQLTGTRVAHIITVVETMVQRNEQQQFFEKVREIDRIFKCALNVPMNNRSFRRKMLKYAIMILTIYMSPQLHKLGGILLSDLPQQFFINWILYLMPYVICSMHYFQIFIAISIIKQRFERLIDMLEELCKNSKIILPSTTKFATTEQMNRCSDMKNSELQKLLIIRDLYNRLWDLTAIMNRCVGVSVLINVTNDLTLKASHLYWIFLTFDKNSSTYFNFLVIAWGTFWSIPYICNVLVLAILCDRTAQSTTKMALCFHRIENYCKNNNLNMVIKPFSLQLLHQKINFTVAGFFNVDCTLLQTIVGVTTTYFITLIQFHMIDKDTNS